MAETMTDKRMAGLTPEQTRVVTNLRDGGCLVRGHGERRWKLIDRSERFVEKIHDNTVKVLRAWKFLKSAGEQAPLTAKLVYAAPGEVKAEAAKAAAERLDRERREAAEWSRKLDEVASTIEHIAMTGTRDELIAALRRIDAMGIHGF